MFRVQQIEQFSDWLRELKDRSTRLRLVKRLKKAELGNLGDVAPVGEGIQEMREHFGPGWRMYFIQRGGDLIVMLAGGDKAKQQRDIEQAQALARQYDQEMQDD